MSKLITIDVDLEDVGTRLDVLLTTLLGEFSRTRIQELIKSGCVLVNDKTSKSSYKLRLEDQLRLNLPEEKVLEVLPENIPLEFIYEDDYIALVNKPVDMLTHPAPGKYTGTLVNALLYHCKDSLSGINGVLRPGIVHRLDRDTTGLLLIAKNDLAHKHLAKQIRDRTVDKYYIAIVDGNIKEDQGVIEAPIGRHPVKREKMAIVEDGRYARTKWSVLERFGQATLVEAKLITGRTHQLRVHFSSIKHPILGDPVYNSTKKSKFNLSRQLLQAYKISFTHPVTEKRLTYQVEIDADIQKIMRFYASRLLTKEKEE